ncbi:MAG: hypothetical protein M1482_10290, partial [Chloroflexi bacterium]|nr:hypothetical protein [Chloroflexota bacterium]
MKKLRFSPMSFVGKTWVLALVLAAVVLATQEHAQPARAARAPVPVSINKTTVGSSPAAGNHVFLPFVTGGVLQQTQPSILGVYEQSGYWLGSQANINSYLKGIDSWAGLSHSANKGHSVAGLFLDIQDSNPSSNVTDRLELLWSNGYTSFINLNTSKTAAYVAGGGLDSSIRAVANAYKAWLQNGSNRKAYIAPLQEMNGDWIPYGCDPTNFKAAYARIQNIFSQAGVTRNQVWWVFAPNGWSSPCHTMDEYYPGDSTVDVVGISAYNFGVCSGGSWQTPDQVYGPYLDIVRNNVTSTKPVIVAQTGSSASGGNRDQWLRDAYAYLALHNVRMVIYYNLNVQCDWRVYTPDGSVRVQGYKNRRLCL